MNSQLSTTPLLARALAALAGIRTPFEAGDSGLIRFTGAVARMDEADRAYRTAIERILPPAKAREMLDAMATFRAEVSELRERVRKAAGYGEFDPLHTHVPALPVSHAEAVRAANTADLARAEVAQMRTRVNARIGAVLDPSEVERLIEAKRARNAVFDAAVRAAAPPDVTDRLATQLVLLADSWY